MQASALFRCFNVRVLVAQMTGIPEGASFMPLSADEGQPPMHIQEPMGSRMLRTMSTPHMASAMAAQQQQQQQQHQGMGQYGMFNDPEQQPSGQVASPVLPDITHLESLQRLEVCNLTGYLLHNRDTLYIVCIP